LLRVFERHLRRLMADNALDRLPPGCSSLTLPPTRRVVQPHRASGGATPDSGGEPDAAPHAGAWSATETAKPGVILHTDSQRTVRREDRNRFRLRRGRRACPRSTRLWRNVREVDLDVLSLKRHEPHRITSRPALGSSRIIADHRERVGRRHVPNRRDVRCWPIRPDREDELDFADVGGETGTTTHGASPSASASHHLPPSRSSPLDPAHDEIDAAGPSSPVSPSASASQGISSFQPK